ncbi:hypothetical protein BaRGS_00013826 [Batillaria attramentaria]|uniref:Uncharacterized protein n=1 Tax=Batillaria attramentaria TaxID=370345 RepID=A0ABD0L6F8_9CAEN
MTKTHTHPEYFKLKQFSLVELVDRTAGSVSLSAGLLRLSFLCRKDFSYSNLRPTPLPTPQPAPILVLTFCSWIVHYTAALMPVPAQLTRYHANVSDCFRMFCERCSSSLQAGRLKLQQVCWQAF